MSLLGYGACRASDRSSGTRVPSYARNVGACRAMCKEDAYCVAVEYDPSTGLCKLHRQPIVSSTGLVGSGPFGINMQDQHACYTFPGQTQP